MSSSILILILTIIVPFFVLLVSAQNFPSYEQCAPHKCGKSTIQYPFGSCGLLNPVCKDYHTILFTFNINFNSLSCRVVGDITQSSYSTRTLQVVQVNIGHDRTGIFDSSAAFFNLTQDYRLGTIGNCTQQPALLKVFSNVTWLDCRESNRYCFFYPEAGFQSPSCKTYPLVVPTDKMYNISADKNFERLQNTGFKITWPTKEACHFCQLTGGICYTSLLIDYCICRSHVYYQYCPDGEYHQNSFIDHTVFNDPYLLVSLSCFCVLSLKQRRMELLPQYGNGSLPQSGKRKLSEKAMAEIFSPICAVVSIVIVSCILFRRQIRCYKSTATVEQHSIRAFMEPLDSRPPSVENFLHYYSSQVPTRYFYSQIRSYTNNFAHKVGKGGFGTVYKGNLPSGSLIAVKILDESKQSEQQFIAEVATVGTTYHVNLVRLLGYCSQGSRRGLVYEYMANGSLEKYIHGDHEQDLNWKQLNSIAVGTARGIAYLHEECSNRILHCDIKPHNVLLDSNFLPKVADFGLAKISDREKSHISVTNRGTLGYSAPEMWSRMYGPVTDRSDVYSYGMLIMEMVGGRNNFDFDNRESTPSKFYYPEWAFKQVEKGEIGTLRKGNLSEEDQGIAKRLSLVGFWCIQFIASHRPSMREVIQMLEGNADITTPPFPFPVETTPLQPSVSGQSSSTYT